MSLETDKGPYGLSATIKEFYPDSKMRGKKVFGGLYVVVTIGGMAMDIRGVLASQQSDGSFFVKLPCKQGVDHRNGRSVLFTIFQFVDPELNEKLIKFIADEAPAFINSWLEARNLPVVAKSEKSDTAIAVTSNATSQEPAIKSPLKGGFQAGKLYLDPPKRTAKLVKRK